MLVLAHFTPAELPGTLAIVLISIVMGIGFARDQRVVVIGALMFAIFSVLSALADGLNWSHEAKVIIDLAALAGGFAMIRALWLTLPPGLRHHR